MSQLSPEKKEAWAIHLQAHRESGLSQQAYCDNHSLSPPQFWYWKRKLEGNENKKNKQPPASTKAGFVPVNVINTAPSPSVQNLTVALPNGITLSGIDEQNHRLVQKMIGAWL